jgi:nucleotide-binding universal stress UspA family protein
MTTHGYGGLVRFWLGSVADSLCRLTSVPILLVRPTETLPDLAHPPLFHQVLVPLDGSALSEQILEPTLALSALLPTEYRLLRIVEPLYADYNLITHTEALDKEAIQTAQSYLDALAQELRRRNLFVSTQVILAENPALAILEQAQHCGATLIAMATHGRSGVRRLLIGSIADKVLRGAETAILVYRPQEGPLQG